MKVTFIASDSFDYLQDIVYNGLISVLGPRNVKTIPFRPSYVFNYKTYPKNLGFSSFSLSSLNQSLRNTDCVIVGSAKPSAFSKYLKVQGQIPANCPVIFLDGGDRKEIGGDLDRLGGFDLYEESVFKRDFDLIFKREKIIGEAYPNNVLPCPFAANIRIYNTIKSVEKKYHISFWAVESHPIRSKALSKLNNKYDCKENGTVLNQVFKDYNRKGNFYLEELKRCELVLNLRGGGWDTLRYWEVPALQTCMISQKMGIEIPNDFEDGKHVIHINESLDDLVDKIDFYLKKDNLREEIAKQGYQHLLQYHTAKKRAEYILREISNL